MFAVSSKSRRTPFVVQLWSLLAVGAIGVALLIATVVGDRAERHADMATREAIHRATLALAQRAAPLLERDDQLRLAVLAASVADVSATRVVLLDADGVVQLDTGLALGGQKLELETSDGVVERTLETDHPVWEVCAPALSNSGFVGEARLQYRLNDEALAGFPWDVFGLALLGSLTLVVLAWWLVHHWVSELRGVAERMHALGAPELEVEFEPDLHDGAVLNVLSRAVDRAGEQLADERRRSQEAGLDLAGRLVRSLEQRGLALVGHGDRTRRYALTLAEAADLPGACWHDLAIAAALIDIGKAGVRASALTSTGELTHVERESLRYAPARGASFLAGLPETAEITRAIRHHHEKYNGTGYPDGLRGERIPLQSRVLAIADAYDLLTAGEGLTWPEALDRLHEDRGEHFDPDLLDAFEAEIRRNPTPSVTEDPVGSAYVIAASERINSYKLADEHEETEVEEVEESEDPLAGIDVELELWCDEPTVDGEEDKS